jgi:hypothetical protein
MSPWWPLSLGRGAVEKGQEDGQYGAASAGDFGILNVAHAQERTTMSDRSSQRKPTPAAPQAMGNIKEKKGQGTNDPELQAEGEAIDSAISSSLFLAPRQELLKKEAELKEEKEERGVKPKET